MNARLTLDLEGSGDVTTAAAKSAALWALATTFQPLTTFPEIRQEARVRLAATYLRLARSDLALQQLGQAAAQNGVAFIDYLIHYLSANAHQQQGHAPQAQAEYRAALSVIPRAQSSAIPRPRCCLPDLDGTTRSF